MKKILEFFKGSFLIRRKDKYKALGRKSVMLNYLKKIKELNNG